MAYIGTPPSNAFTSLLKQDFSTSATTGYTLDHAVNNANDIALFINFVRQEPTAGYAASGTTLTLTSATASSDDMYCVYLGQALQTVNPPNASVGLSQLTATGTKDATTFLRGDNTFASAGGANTPNFSVTLASNQTIPTGTWTKLSFATEFFDSDNAFASNKFTVASGKSGKYFFGYTTRITNLDDGENVSIKLYKNGSAADVERSMGSNFSSATNAGTNVSGFYMINTSVNDYYEVYVYHGEGADQTAEAAASVFFGYKIIE